MDEAREGAGCGRRGFSLIEVVIVILIVAVMVSFLLPALSGTIGAADEAVSVSRVRQNAAMVGMYTADHGGIHPSFTDPQADYSVLRSDAGDVAVRYFDATVFWNFAMIPGGYAESVLDEVFRAPDQMISIVTDYRYAACFIAAPEFWAAETRTGPTQWRATRSSQVVYPSAKGMIRRLVYSEVSESEIVGDELDVGYADGHAERTGQSELRPGYPHGEGEWIGSTRVVGSPVHHTIGGVRGRDRD